MRCGASVSVLTELLFVMQLSDIRLLIFRKPTRRRSFMLCFLLCGNQANVFAKGQDGILLYFSNRTKSPKVSSFRLFGVGRLSLQTRLSSLSVNFNVKYLLMPSRINAGRIYRYFMDSVTQIFNGVMRVNLQGESNRSWTKIGLVILGCHGNFLCHFSAKHKVFGVHVPQLE